jgi:hypothetical protein
MPALLDGTRIYLDPPHFNRFVKKADLNGETFAAAQAAFYRYCGCPCADHAKALRAYLRNHATVYRAAPPEVHKEKSV